jgi:hypothetical protein
MTMRLIAPSARFEKAVILSPLEAAKDLSNRFGKDLWRKDKSS